MLQKVGIVVDDFNLGKNTHTLSLTTSNTGSLNGKTTTSSSSALNNNNETNHKM